MNRGELSVSREMLPPAVTPYAIARMEALGALGADSLKGRATEKM